MTRDVLTSGTVLVTVTLPETFVRARELLGDSYHASYTYRIERVENERGPATFFLHTLTDRPGRTPQFVYTGVVHPYKGSVRLTRASAFPVTATRVRVASRVLQALFAGRADAITTAGWRVDVTVEKELAERF